MAEQQGSPQSGQTYLFDPESAAEMGRLILQDKLLNQAMGGLFPERADLANITRILDIACGPGGWAMSVAREHPSKDVTGIDISTVMISYANTQVAREELSNVRFAVMNAVEPLKFPDGSFDLVNIRAGTSFIPRTVWPIVMQECLRILKPGGTLRLTEFDSVGISNSAAFEQFNRIGMQFFRQRGLGFSPDGASTVGMTFMLGKFLMDVGCQNIGYRPLMVDFSYGSPYHATQLQNVSTMFKQAQAMMEKLAPPSDQTRAEAKRLYDKLQNEMQSPSFRGCQYWLTAWGVKPQA